MNNDTTGSRLWQETAALEELANTLDEFGRAADRQASIVEEWGRELLAHERQALSTLGTPERIAYRLMRLSGWSIWDALVTIEEMRGETDRHTTDL